MSILTTPQRLAQMLADSNENIRSAYYLTQEGIDQIERPAWLVFVEDESYPHTSQGQELSSQSYSLAYIGQPFSGTGVADFTQEYEVLARQIAVDTILYLLEHPGLQVSNDRGLLPDALGWLDGVMQMVVNSRSAITLFTRDGVESMAFWGFTVSITVTEQIVYEAIG